MKQRRTLKFSQIAQDQFKKTGSESTLSKRIHSTTSRQQTSPVTSRFKQIDKITPISFKTQLPFVLQNKYFGLTSKEQ